MKFTLRTALFASFAIVGLLPLLAASYFAIGTFQTRLEEQAQAAVNTQMRASTDVLESLVHDHENHLATAVTDGTLADLVTAGSSSALSEHLNALALDLELTFALVVANDGRVIGSSTGTPGYGTDWALLGDLASGGSDHGIAVVPEDDLSRLGIADRLIIPIVQDADDPESAQPLDGALAAIALVPLTDASGLRVGTVVGAEAFARSTEWVDAVSDTFGGSAAIFQRDVRIATNIMDADDHRAIGRVAGEQAVSSVLGSGEDYRGKTDVVGVESVTAYDPILDPDGDIVGMVYVGTPLEPFNAQVSNFAVNMTFFLVVAAIFVIAAAFTVSRLIVRPLDDVANAAGQVATGHLRTSVPERGYHEAVELGETFNAMTRELSSLIDQVYGSSSRLSTIAREISEAAQSSASGSAEEAASVAQVSATIEQLSRTFSSVASGAERVMSLSEATLASAESGNSTLEENTEAVNALAGGTQETMTSVERLADVSQRITDMTTLITNIAEQTKILALNAAIEAARAGEAGLGFGVVASEIRGLADSVGESASGIATMVDDIHQASTDLFAVAKTQNERAVAGLTHGTRTHEAFDEILGHMHATTTAAREIVQAATQQQTALQQVVSAMQQVSVASTETATAAQQLAASAGGVESEAGKLDRSLSRFETH